MPLYLQNRQACLSIRHRSMKKSYSLESTVVIPFTQGLQWAAVPLWVAGPPASFPCTRAHSPDSSWPTCSTSARAQHTGVMRLSLFTISHKGWQGKAFNLSYWTGQYKTQLHFKFILLIGLVVLIIKRKGTEEMRKREKKTLKIMEKKLSNTSEFLKERECYWAKIRTQQPPPQKCNSFKLVLGCTVTTGDHHGAVHMLPPWLVSNCPVWPCPAEHRELFLPLDSISDNWHHSRRCSTGTWGRPTACLGDAHRRTAMTWPWGSSLGSHGEACMQDLPERWWGSGPGVGMEGVREGRGWVHLQRPFSPSLNLQLPAGTTPMDICLSQLQLLQKNSRDQIV